MEVGAVVVVGSTGGTVVVGCGVTVGGVTGAVTDGGVGDCVSLGAGGFVGVAVVGVTPEDGVTVGVTAVLVVAEVEGPGAGESPDD